MMIKRLKKLVSINLKHATTLEKFIGICNSGSIEPYNNTGLNTLSNSLDKDSIYLSKYSSKTYAYEFSEDSKYKVGVCLNVNVNENNLLPSYDFKEFEFPEEENGEKFYLKDNGDKISADDNNLTWQDTLDINDECRYKGSIPTSDISDVILYTCDDNLLKKYKKFIAKEISFEKAKEIAYEIIKNED